MNSQQQQNLQSEAAFWKQKYMEQMLNHAQVVAALMRPQYADTETPAVGVPPEDEKPAATQPAVRNGASKASAAKG